MSSPTEEADGIKSYKGFNADLTCRGYQYRVGENYKQPSGGAVRCGAPGGFHACEYPLDVLVYYPPNTSRFAIVEQSGALKRDDEDSKVASEKIRIVEEISLSDLITAAAEYTVSRAIPSGAATNSGYSGAATNSGDSGAATNSGDRGAATNSGYRGAATNSGDRGAATNSGYRGAATNSGDSGAATNSGDRGAATNSGDSGAATNSGDRGAATNSGDRGAATNSGDSGAATNSGDSGAATNSGDSGAATNSGYRGAATNSGYRGAAMNSGRFGKARSSAGGVIFLVYRDSSYEIVHARAFIVGKDEGIKPDTFYMLDENGNPIEVE